MMSYQDEKLAAAVRACDGHGRGGGVDWEQVCCYMGSRYSLGKCRHRWHNVVKHRVMMLHKSPSASPPHTEDGGKEETPPVPHVNRDGTCEEEKAYYGGSRTQEGDGRVMQIE